MKRLLYVVDDTPLEVGRIIAEHSNPRDCLFNDRFLTWPDGLQ